MPGAKEAKNIKAIRRWCTEHRPDILDHIDRFLEADEGGDGKATAMVFLLTIGFAAGREYQQKNPKDFEP